MLAKLLRWNKAASTSALTETPEIDTSEGSAIYNDVMSKVLRNDEAMLRFLLSNVHINNSLLSNFFQYRQSIAEWIGMTGMTVPRHMVEIGCGNIPWTGLRFLLDGTQRYIANDILPVRSAFPASELDALGDFCDIIDRKLVSRWSEVFPPGSGGAPCGMIVKGGVGFETLDLPDDNDFTVSTSVLEHVMDPHGVYRKFQEITPRGGHMFHSIDLRDHRYFGTDDLAFLRESSDRYESFKSENRLRASEHLNLADHYGFDVVTLRRLLLLADGRQEWVGDADAIRLPLGVTVELRDQMEPEFREMGLFDLSTLAIQVLFRKR